MKYILFTAVLASLVGCTTTKEKPTGMSNPASDYCVQQGGRLEMKKDAQGNEFAMCHLKNGQVVEEWDYYRKNHQK